MFAGILVGPAALVLGALVLRQDTSALEDELVRDAEAVLGASRPRPVHSESLLPGTFGDAVARHLPAIEAARRDTQAEEGALRAAAEGRVAASSLPPSVRAALARMDPALDGLLAGTRAPLADLPLARESYVPIDGTTWETASFAALLAAIRVRRLVAEEAGDAAVETCLDGLALGRDVALAGGLVAAMAGVNVVSRLAPACQAALASIDVSSAASVLPRLRRLRDAFPSEAEMLRLEFVSHGLFLFAPVIDEEGRARLGPRASMIVREGDRPTRPWERVLLRASWPGIRRHRANLVEAAASPPARRGAALREAEEKAEHWMNLLVHLEPHFVRYVHRSEATARRLDALVLMLAARSSRAERGTWPQDCERLRIEELVTMEEVERTCSTARLGAAGDGFEIAVPLPQGDPEKDDAQYLVRLSGA